MRYIFIDPPVPHVCTVKTRVDFRIGLNKYSRLIGNAHSFFRNGRNINISLVTAVHKAAPDFETCLFN